MGEYNIGSMTERQRKRSNRICAHEALLRGKRWFMGACREHGETQYDIIPQWKAGRINHLCHKCVLAKEARQRAKVTKDPVDYARKRWNRERLVKALKENKTHVKLKCKHHGIQPFAISELGRARCLECFKEKTAKQRAKRKGETYVP